MSLSISPFNQKEEKKIQDKIFGCVRNNKSLIFSAGAGAGKTYALTESLKYIINNYGEKLKEHNQKIICITYTNIATNEVKNRLGNTDLVKVSTIHERIWELIKNYQKELVEIHKHNLNDEINKLQQKMEDDNAFQRYRDLKKDPQESFTQIMLDPEMRQLFYQNYNENASNLRGVLQNITDVYPDILRNVGNFRKIVSTVYKLDNYKNCVEKIKSQEKGYKTIEYDATFNRDLLHRMRISHDTLLHYGLNIIKKHDLLKQIIIDQYPYVLVDEYQDTNKKVIEIMSYLDNYSRKINHDFFVGYFGDAVQNIYDDGVGSSINEIHSNLIPVNKKFNRRSTNEIITVINSLRDDDIEQLSIYENHIGGSVKFYKGGREYIESFIENYIQKWNVNLDNKLHCLVLTNRAVAEHNGFKNIYNCFLETDKYSGINYQELNSDLLSTDLTKLGDIQKLIFRIIEFRNNLKNSQTPVSNILDKNIYKGINIDNLRGFLGFLKQINGNTLSEYLQSISKIYSETAETKFRELMNKIFDQSNVSYENLYNYFINKLYPDLNDNDIDAANSNIVHLLNINLDEYDLWYNFISNTQDSEVLYRTYHGTKGLEFDNVIIIMENAFGRDRNYFDSFFSNYGVSDDLEVEDKIKFEKISNLLYVSCSRAIRNLRIFYLDDISGFETNIKNIFGEVCQYN